MYCVIILQGGSVYRYNVRYIIILNIYIISLFILVFIHKHTYVCIYVLWASVCLFVCRTNKYIF